MSTFGVSYLDSSAIVKLVLDEVHCRPMRDWAAGRVGATSLVGVAESVRATRRRAPEALPDLAWAIDRVVHLPVGSDVVTLASLLDPPALRSLDAIHLASALALEDTLDAFVTYDRRLAAAASAAGLPVVIPV